ncbi:hypothetical protein HNP48_002242 [Acidovorax soli]|uniref:Uncharacterized protein n=1 Tax=Acidovorax soli TaxID=592050 RepID=A0A7X0U9H9_9BURK|nr:hypothetical protein [Acidovorax soli]MBB6559575.1 hypothetical protein [Acidovorax soli]
MMTFQQLRGVILNKTSGMDHAGARSSNPAIWHGAGMALLAMAYRGVAPTPDGMKQWAAALFLAWAAGACVAGAAKLFGARLFLRNWLVASWVAIVLMVAGSWQGVGRVAPAVVSEPPIKQGDAQAPAAGKSEVDAFLDAYEKAQAASRAR